jgi:hypothetical protein
MTRGVLHEFLARDHKRLDAHLALCLASGDQIPYDSYDAFRRGLLRHISIEERVLFPLLRKHCGATDIERQLHDDHAALAALLVPPPTQRELDSIVSILETHNHLEEDPAGLYDLIETLAGNGLDELMARAHAIPEVRVAPHASSPIVFSSIETLLKKVSGRR